MASARPPIWIVLKAHVIASPRKSAVLAILFVVMVGMYVRLFVSGPARSAQAEAVNAAGENSTDASIKAPTETKDVRPTRKKLAEALSCELGRDPFGPWFAISDPGEPADVASTPSSIIDEAAALELEVTVSGDDPMAVINGRVLRPGDEIAGFVLDSVEPRHVRLSKDGVPVVVRLK